MTHRLRQSILNIQFPGVVVILSWRSSSPSSLSFVLPPVAVKRGVVVVSIWESSPTKSSASSLPLPSVAVKRGVAVPLIWRSSPKSSSSKLSSLVLTVNKRNRFVRQKHKILHFVWFGFCLTSRSIIVRSFWDRTINQ